MMVTKLNTNNKNISFYITQNPNSGERIYIIDGTEKRMVIGCGKLPEEFRTGIDYMVLNQYYPDMIRYIPEIFKDNPGMTVIATSDMANFTGEFTRCGFRSHKVVAKSIFDLGGTSLTFIKLAGVSRSRHKDRSWSKGQKFPQIPNWQWQDSMFAFWPDEKIIFTGQMFGAYRDREFKSYFNDHQAPYPGYVDRILMSMERFQPETAYPSCGPACKFSEGAEQYRKFLKEYEPEDDFVLLVYASNFGYTKAMIEAFANGVSASGKLRTVVVDINQTPENEILKMAGKAAGIVAGTPTIEAGAAPEMNRLWANLTQRICKGKFGASIGNFSYSPKGAKIILQRMDQLEMKIVEPAYSLRFRPDEEQLDTMKEFGEHFAECMCSGNVSAFVKKEREPEALNVNSNQSFVIIGNGAAGTAVAEKLRELDASCRIEIIDKNPYNCYNRIAITRAIRNDVLYDHLELKHDEWYEERNIKTTFGTAVTAVDPENRTVTCDDGSVRTYDALFYAAGADPFIPDVPGIDAPYVFPLHSKADIDGIRAYVKDQEIKRVLVIGGGILGLEAAEEFNHSYEVTVADSAPYLMPRHCDAKAAEMVKLAALKAGIQVLTGARLTGVSDGKAAFLLESDQTKTLEADLIVISAGLKPGQVPKGLEAITSGGFIKINERAESPVEHIYACGDCASFREMNLGLWKQATEMAKVAAYNALGAEYYYKTTTPDISFTGFGLSFYSIGNIAKLIERKMEVQERMNPFSNEYEKLYYDRVGSFMGGVLIGRVDKAADLIEAWHKEM